MWGLQSSQRILGVGDGTSAWDLNLAIVSYREMSLREICATVKVIAVVWEADGAEYSPTRMKAYNARVKATH